jgi:hypothetical protein
MRLRPFRHMGKQTSRSLPKRRRILPTLLQCEGPLLAHLRPEPVDPSRPLLGVLLPRWLRGGAAESDPNATFAATQKMCVDRLHMAWPCGSYVALGGNLGLAMPDIKGPNRLPMTASSPTTSPPAAPEKAAAAGRRRERVRRGSGYNPGLCCGSLESARHLRPFDVPANPARSRCLSGPSRAVPSRDWPRPGSRR